MKIKINIDCTPEEARTFFGLPDVQPMQRAMMDRMQAQMEKQMEQFDPAELMKMWLTPGMEGLSQFQKAMWNAATGSGGHSGSKDE